jgi:hypothetical protein
MHNVKLPIKNGYKNKAQGHLPCALFFMWERTRRKLSVQRFLLEARRWAAEHKGFTEFAQMERILYNNATW